jgi:hypothetical protein
MCVVRHVFHYEVEDGLVYLCMVDQQDKVLSSHLTYIHTQANEGIHYGSGVLTCRFGSVVVVVCAATADLHVPGGAEEALQVELWGGTGTDCHRILAQ